MFSLSCSEPRRSEVFPSSPTRRGWGGQAVRCKVELKSSWVGTVLDGVEARMVLKVPVVVQLWQDDAIMTGSFTVEP
eukprot:754453-Hanusia_phi.AAC.5